MKNSLLDIKWIGILCVAAVSCVLAYFASGYAVRIINAMTPTVVTEASQFLPITVENGMIVEPKDTLISENYGSETKPFWVVLDTRTDELSSDDIKNQGVYISRKFVYGVSAEKTEIRSLASTPDITVDQSMLMQGADWMETKSGGYIFAAFLVGLMMYIGIVVFIYAAVIYLLLGSALKTGFRRVLRVTTLGYLALFILSIFTVSIHVILTFVLLLGLNYWVAKYIPQRTE